MSDNYIFLKFSGTCFVGAAVWQYEEMRKRAHRFLKVPNLFEPSTSKYKRYELRRQVNIFIVHMIVVKHLLSLFFAGNYNCWCLFYKICNVIQPFLKLSMCVMYLLLLNKINLNIIHFFYLYI